MQFFGGTLEIVGTHEQSLHYDRLQHSGGDGVVGDVEDDGAESMETGMGRSYEKWSSSVDTTTQHDHATSQPFSGEYHETWLTFLFDVFLSSLLILDMPAAFTSFVPSSMYFSIKRSLFHLCRERISWAKSKHVRTEEIVHHSHLHTVFLPGPYR